jgi:hypothetical protein
MVGGLVSTCTSAACDDQAHVSVCDAEVLDAVKLSAKVSDIPPKNNVKGPKLGTGAMLVIWRLCRKTLLTRPGNIAEAS